jgi:hypothetical protein
MNDETAQVADVSAPGDGTYVINLKHVPRPEILGVPGRIGIAASHDGAPTPFGLLTARLYVPHSVCRVATDRGRRLFYQPGLYWIFQELVDADAEGNPPGPYRWLKFVCADPECTGIVLVPMDGVVKLIDL